MISLHMLIFRLMVTMVAELCSLVILIHNTLLGEIMITSTRTTKVNEKIILLFLIVNLFKKGVREDPGNYRGITLLTIL